MESVKKRDLAGQQYGKRSPKQDLPDPDRKSPYLSYRDQQEDDGKDDDCDERR
jgi:hypothetical protein